MTADPYNLQRFLDAQDEILEDVLEELARGEKASHWMWYVFPQLKGLGFSSTSQFYGISGRAEARAYLEHPVLGQRLVGCTKLVISHPGLSAEQIFGYPDYLKFCSCMTLFEAVSDSSSVFTEALERFYSGTRDKTTLSALA